MAKRDISIDYLRFIGLSLIILAHVNPPALLFNIRCFDVPLMLFVSGLAYSGRKVDFSFQFLSHRFTRLVVPVYIFLTSYFSATTILAYAGIDFGIRKEHIIGSYLLTDGIGFVWIIRVFLLIALLTPLLIKIEAMIKNTILLMILICSISIITTGMIVYNIGMDHMFIREYLYYTVGYSVMFVLGLRTRKMPREAIIKTTIVFFIVFLSYAFLIGKDFWLVNNYKYPPQFYYIVYGALMSMIIYAIICRTEQVKRFGNYPIPLFIAQNTIWIYLYHIPFVQLTGLVFHDWYIRYPIVYICAVCACFLQVTIVDRLAKRKQRKIYKYLKS